MKARHQATVSNGEVYLVNHNGKLYEVLHETSVVGQFMVLPDGPWESSVENAVESYA
jgi:hypothetical protein